MKVIAKSLIKHNGNYYQVGQELPAMSEPDIAKLVAANVVTVQDGNVAPALPTDPNTVPGDKTLETKGVQETANLPIAMTMKKTALIGIARANGIKVDQTATPSEVYKLIKEFRAKEGIVVEDVEPVKKPNVKNPEAPKPEDVAKADELAKEDAAPHGEGEDKGKNESKTPKSK